MNVLLLGDSHTHGGYGQSLEALFKGAGHTVTRVGWVSVTGGQYLSGKYRSLKLGHTGDYDSQVKGKSFDLAVISLGTNEAAGVTNTAQADTAIANIRKLMTTFSSPRIYWVGPPAFSDNAARTYNPAFAKMDLNARAALVWNAGSAAFGNAAIDPRAATKAYTLSNNIHFGPAGGKAWAQTVFNAVAGPGSTSVTPPDPAGDEAAGTGMPPNVFPKAFPWVPVAAGGGVLVLGLVAALLWRRRKRLSLPAAVARPSMQPAMAGVSSRRRRWSR